MTKAQYMKQLGWCTITLKGVWAKFKYVSSFNNFVLVKDVKGKVSVINARDIGFIGVG